MRFNCFPKMKRFNIGRFSQRFLLCGVLLTGLSLPVRGADWTPDPSLSSPALHHRLYEIGRKYAEANFDPDANLVGSQSKHPPNKKQHATRESAYYAYGLLLTGDLADRERAQAILRRVVTAQDTKSQLATRGAFNWYFETPADDLNSAAFVGMALADIVDLDRHHPALDSDLLKQVEGAARLSVEAVMRRDVDPAYTNIAMLSTGLAAAGERLLGVSGAGAWAEAKLDNVLKMAGDSEFAEYLSPTYYAVSLDGAYEAKRYAFSEAFASKADQAINHLWQQIAASYHAPTFQLAGPYVRAYGDNMLEYAAGLKYMLYLALDGNYPLPDTETDHQWDKGGLMVIATLPIGPRPEFKQPPEAWREFKVTGLPATPVRVLRQYKEGNFTLGTVAFQDEWKQKRNLVAFWRTDGATPDQFRIGFCNDQSNEVLPAGVAPDRIHFYSNQVKGAALVALVASTVVPGLPGTSLLVFDHDAKVSGGADSAPLRIEDGAYTAYLYPVATGPVAYKSEPNTRTLWVTRSWATADAVGDLRVMSYLLVFRPSNAPAPSVTDITLKGAGHDCTASAKVDGVDVTVAFKD